MGSTASRSESTAERSIARRRAGVPSASSMLSWRPRHEATGRVSHRPEAIRPCGSRIRNVAWNASSTSCRSRISDRHTFHTIAEWPCQRRDQGGLGYVVVMHTAGGLESFEELTVRQAYRGTDIEQDPEISEHDAQSAF